MVEKKNLMILNNCSYKDGNNGSYNDDNNGSYKYVSLGYVIIR